MKAWHLTTVIIACAVAPLLWAHAAASQSDRFPHKPVRIIAASAPGGDTIATDLVAKALPDGHTLRLQSVGIAYVGKLRKQLPFDVLRDLLPGALVVNQPSLPEVHISVPATSVAELVALAKNRALQYGTSGAGGTSHLGIELFAVDGGINLTPVAYEDTGAAFTTLLGGETRFAIVVISTALPHVHTGRIRALGVTGATRSPLTPEIPTAREDGVAAFEFDVWNALFGPAALPHAISLKISADVKTTCCNRLRRARACLPSASIQWTAHRKSSRHFFVPKSPSGASSSSTQASNPNERHEHRSFLTHDPLKGNTDVPI